MEDQTIIDLYWARDQQAIAATDRKYGGLCRTLSHNIVNDWEDADECVNDTWHRAWTTMPPQRPGSLRAYLSRIVRNLSIDCWRRKSRQKRDAGLEVLLGELEDCLPAVSDPQKLTEEQETARIIGDWLDTLPREDRVLFLRRYWYGDPVAELAAALHWSPNRMAQKLRRLRLALRAVLEKEGISL